MNATAHNVFRRVIGGGLAGLLLMVSGCSPYQLRGIVIQGDRPGIEIVGSNDPRLDYFGLPGAEIQVTLDPDKLSSKSLGKTKSDAGGVFAIPVDEPGVGVLIYEVQVQVSRDEFQTVLEDMNLPGGNKHLVVTMRAGKPEMSKDKGTLLEETLRDAQPYLDP